MKSTNPSGYFVRFGEKVKDGVNGFDAVKADVELIFANIDSVKLEEEVNSIDGVGENCSDDVNSEESGNEFDLVNSCEF